MKIAVLFSLMTLLALAWPVVPAGAQSASRVEAPRFFESLGDVPLMPGLHELADESVVFDKPGGRIAQGAAAMPGNAADPAVPAGIDAFYARTLPQMGWAPAGERRYAREGEILTYALEHRGGFSIVHFTVAPALENP